HPGEQAGTDFEDAALETRIGGKERHEFESADRQTPANLALWSLFSPPTMPKRVEYRGHDVDMKPGPDRSEFNTPQEMAARLAYILFLGSFMAGFLLVTAGLFSRDVRSVALGLVLLGVSMIARTWVRRNQESETVAGAMLADLRSANPPIDASQ